MYCRYLWSVAFLYIIHTCLLSATAGLSIRAGIPDFRLSDGLSNSTTRKKLCRLGKNCSTDHPPSCPECTSSSLETTQQLFSRCPRGIGKLHPNII